eukprot:TRINITY_DN75108_c0_g1_i1.p1 TRINITY_DN75108_c0_g1~~TRINITY_DN75108_c0_g1_i1.p1  ORF type:complete len:1009 (+),score=172.13 TRINITY_DN75108_c0_g1_i1:70-3027(+)
MDVTVKHVGNLPPRTHLCIKYGEQRRLAPFRQGETVSFSSPASPEKMPKYYSVDVLRKVGSVKVCLAGISALGGTIQHDNLLIPPLDINLPPISVNLESTLGREAGSSVLAVSKKKQVALKAKQYLEKHGMQNVLHEMFTQLLERQPADPLDFMAAVLERLRDEQDEKAANGIDRPRAFALEPGLGDRALPGFADGRSPEDLPDLSQHHSFVADVLKETPSSYEKLRGEATGLGVTAAQCIKPGMDCPGHELLKVAGIVAGDGECYDKFQDLFDPVIGSLHASYVRGVPHPTDGNPAKLDNSAVDPEGSYVVHTTVETRRNFSHVRFLTCCSRDERRDVERLATKALLSLDVPLTGIYLPLRWSRSYPELTDGMASYQEDQLRKAGMLFSYPDSRLRLSAGLGRQWPDARGVFMGEMQGFYVWVNEEDHLRFFARQSEGGNLKDLWTCLNKIMRQVEHNVSADGLHFSRSERLGYLTACPSKLGTGLSVTVAMRLRLLPDAVHLPALCRSLLLQCSQEVGAVADDHIWNISNADVLGVSEVDILSGVKHGLAALVALEKRLEHGQPIYSGMPGLGEKNFPGFRTARCPPKLPDLSFHYNLMARVLRGSPSTYTQLRRLKTANGVSLAACIKPGMDERDARSTSPAAMGLVAGDEECYTLFAPLFDPVLERYFGVPLPRDFAVEVGDLGKLGSAQLNKSGLHVVSVTVEFRRNLRSFRLLPCASMSDRREVERLMVKSLVELRGGDLAGEYFPLKWSDSYGPKPGGMLKADEEMLHVDGFLFSEPTTCARLASGFGRDWPDARGVYKASRGDICIWCNEEDHIRLMSKQGGGDLQGVFRRGLRCLQQLDEELRSQQSELAGSSDARAAGDAGDTSVAGTSAFAYSRRLGYLTASPENLGSGGVSCTVALRLPHLGSRTDFEGLCEQLRLRAGWRGGVWEVSGVPAIQGSEVELVNRVLAGCNHLVRLEQLLEQGQGTTSSEIQREV